jgi:hypothetical protein
MASFDKRTTNHGKTFDFESIMPDRDIEVGDTFRGYVDGYFTSVKVRRNGVFIKATTDYGETVYRSRLCIGELR